MNDFWEELYWALCPSYDETIIPEYLKDNPVLAYGQYAFREDVRLGLKLACGTFVDEN